MTSIPPKAKRSYRPPFMPAGKSGSRLGTAVSVFVHLLILYLLVMPENYGGLVVPIEQGAGGPGPAGGGGGRSSAKLEIIQYVQVAPAPPPVVKPTIVFVPPPEIIVPPPQLEPLKMLEPVVAPGATTGSAQDPNGGAGPGTGGGVGSGVGPGKGSSIGSGTGGGDQPNFPPAPTEMILPPLPVPPRLRGASVLVEFDVDEKGKVLSFKFTETSDRGYNKRLADVFKTYRFRPGTRPDGSPLRMKAQIKVEL